MCINDERLKEKALRAINLQEQGAFVLDYHMELPLARPDAYGELRYSNTTDERGRYYDYETNWGKFSFDTNWSSGLLVLRKGMPPATIDPQSRLSLVSATLHSGYASIHNNGSSFDIDFKTCDRNGHEALRLLNQTLAEENIPVVVWSLDDDEEETPPVIRISNDSALIFASSVIWDNESAQLVAAQTVNTAPELLKAIKASLANNNSKSIITIKTQEDSAYLKGAKRGYISVSNNLAQANAEGTVTTLLHPLSGDPQANAADHFYVVVVPGESIAKKFSERLDLAIPWPVQPDWADFLLEAGQDAELVQVLPASGTDFLAGLRVKKNETDWNQLISNGLKAGRIFIS